MRKLIAMATLAVFGLPALAQPEITRWNTAHSMGCMMMRECTEGVKKTNNPAELAEQLGVRFTEDAESELGYLFESFDKLGIEFFVAEDKYFLPRTRGVYYTAGNKFYLNSKYMDNPTQILETIRHEGWHAAQDCMAGTLHNNHIAVIWNDGVVPQGYVVRANVAYAMQPQAIPWEAEAMWAAETPNMTANALNACAHPGGKMWDVYTPTPMTGEWLVDNGYWDGVTR